jgi:hypothetical protein
VMVLVGRAVGVSVTVGIGVGVQREGHWGVSTSVALGKGGTVEPAPGTSANGLTHKRTRATTPQISSIPTTSRISMLLCLASTGTPPPSSIVWEGDPSTYPRTTPGTNVSHRVS